MHIYTDTALYYDSIICVPQGEIRQKNLSRGAQLSIFNTPRGNKYVLASEQHFWWNAMRIDHTIYIKMLGMSASEGRTSEIRQASSTIAYTRMEVGECHHEFRYSATQQSERK